MAKLSDKYEAVVIFNSNEGEESTKATVEKVTAIITKNATLDSTDEWGKRRLAYEINDQTEGYYVLYKFTCEPSVPAEIDRLLKITDGILRSQIVKQIAE